MLDHRGDNGLIKTIIKRKLLCHLVLLLSQVGVKAGGNKPTIPTGILQIQLCTGHSLDNGVCVYYAAACHTLNRAHFFFYLDVYLKTKGACKVVHCLARSSLHLGFASVLDILQGACSAADTVQHPGLCVRSVMLTEDKLT